MARRSTGNWINSELVVRGSEKSFWRAILESTCDRSMEEAVSPWRVCVDASEAFPAGLHMHEYIQAELPLGLDSWQSEETGEGHEEVLPNVLEDTSASIFPGQALYLCPYLFQHALWMLSTVTILKQCFF